jgi:5'-3' exonuclease
MQFGCFRTLESIKRRNPQAPIVWVRDGHCGRRRELSPGYKASRGEHHDPDVYNTEAQQDIFDLVLASGCWLAYHPDHECDDLIANLCYDDRIIVNPVDYRTRIYILSGDHDFHQLASSNGSPLDRLKKDVRIWKPGKDEKIISSAEVYAEWGVEPTSLALYRSIVGDVSDEIKGLARVPREPLRQAVASAQSVSDFYEGDGLAYFTPEWKQRLLDFRSQCEMNYRLTALPWEYIRTPLTATGVQGIGLHRLFSKLEFNSYLRKFDETLNLFSQGVMHEQVSGKPQ